MQFQRLRLVGFKSFVDPTEVHITPGLTGIVGPNGCGKSNVLESLRWVMGANSAKAMRGQGMDDVIFAGAADRPARSHAEVSLSIDNSQRRAPQPFTDSAVLEVSRRIDRGQGSTYRINGKEVRARDVQLLFADASTGANSPALVRQGQISELIAAKPQNRRRILEEAGGVSGLHTRRHEAELRLKAAETNLDRLDDIGKELETALTRLKREARQAEKYRKISAEIRALQSAVLLARWKEAVQARDDATAALREAEVEVGRTEVAAAHARTEALKAQEGLKPAREEDAVAGAVLHRATLERDRLDMAEQAARAEVERLEREAARIAADLTRETAMAGDAEGELTRLSEAVAALEAEIESAPTRGPELDRALEQADADRQAAEAEVERLTSELAAVDARARAEAARREEAETRLARLEASRAQTAAEREALAPSDTPEQAGAEAALTTAQADLAAAREAVEQAEADRADLARAEQDARTAARTLEDKLGRLQTEARGLAQLLARGKRDHPPALDSVQAARGYEAALAAALGEDLDAALDPAAAAHWSGAEAAPPLWPEGVTPLSDHVTAPVALSARLAWCGVAPADRAPQLARRLPVGARLVTKEGDLYRWDGLVVRAEAPRPAAIRLEQRTRLSEVETDIDQGRPALDTAQAELKSLTERLRSADEAVKAARLVPFSLDKAVAAARDRVEALARDTARREARAQSLDEALTRLDTEIEAASAAVEDSRAIEAPATSPGELRARVAEARAASETARTATAQARLERDTEARAVEGRTRQLHTLTRERDAWSGRGQEAR
ncbi:MAG: AAA family ATPase, partial [Alphaproteobacteria bacterium]|nr:AAA family ATPase [Alphaproteobacteria bacterium]